MDFAAARVKMVDNQIRTTDVTDNAILRAFLNVPRELFAPDERRDLSYMGGEIPLGGGRVMMEASPLAKLVQLADVRGDDRCLVVGALTGYSCAILSRLAREVVGLEERDDLVDGARTAVVTGGAANVEIVSGRLSEGYAAGAPFDVILLEGAVDAVPDALVQQLAERGRMVGVVGHGNGGMAQLWVRDGDVVSNRFGFNCSLRPLPGFQNHRGFVF